MLRDRKSARIAIAVLLLSVVSASPSFASGSKNQGLSDAGRIVAIALPIAAGSVSLYKDDWVGVVQLIAVTGLTGATASGLKQVVRERRPDGSDWKSFPSDQSALAFAPAAYLWDAMAGNTACRPMRQQASWAMRAWGATGTTGGTWRRARASLGSTAACSPPSITRHRTSIPVPT